MTDRARRTIPADTGRPALAQKLTAGGVVALVFLVGLSILWAKSVSPLPETDATPTTAMADEGRPLLDAPTTAAPSQGVGMAALRAAAAEDKYLFAFFWKAEDSQTRAMRKIFDETLSEIADRAQAIAVCITDGAERDIVSKFQLTRAPMPLVLAIAPNGAITGGFPGKFTQSDLLGAIASPALQRCMKALQDGKIVLLCAQNDATTSNAEALQGVHAFQSDARFSSATEIVIVNPQDSAEASFLRDLQIDSGITEAVTAFLVPPGSVVAEFQGATTKEALMAALQNAGSCGPGGTCGPGGCGPR